MKNKVLVLSTFLSIIAGLLIVLSLPSTTPYSIASTGLDGLSKLHENFNTYITYSLRDLEVYNASNYVLIVARTKSLEDSIRLKNFIERGGVVVIFGSPEYLVDLLGALGISVRFLGFIRDIICNIGNLDYVVANTTLLCGSIVLREPYMLEGLSGRDMIAYSSMFSYVDINSNGFYDLGEPIGSYPLGISLTLGSGKLIAVFARGVLDNEVLDRNIKFIECITNGREVIIEQSEIVRNPLELMRLLLIQRGRITYTYAVLLFTIVIGLAMVTYIATRE